MKNKYSLERILQEAWGDSWGADYGGTHPDGPVLSAPDVVGLGGSEGIDGYTYPLGLPAGYGYDRPDRIYTSVNSYENDYAGEFTEPQDNPRAAGFPLNGKTIKKSGMTFGANKPGNSFTGPFADYKSPPQKIVRDYGRPVRRLTDILPDKTDGVFVKSTSPRSLGNLYKHFELVK